MPVTDVTQDLDTRTLTITAEFAAPVERIWQVCADPRQLEKVFGSPDPSGHLRRARPHPRRASPLLHDLPEGERYYGWWRVTAVDEPRGFTFEDGFAADATFTDAGGLTSRRTFSRRRAHVRWPA